MKIINGDNLEALEILATSGETFDLIELDGPYNAGLEDWDSLTEYEFLKHYAARLSYLKHILSPRGAVFLFGYPEGCAQILGWVQRSGDLLLRRWISWKTNRTAHKGRKIQTILFFIRPIDLQVIARFRKEIKEKREALKLTVEDAHNLTGIGAGLRGGYAWFESETGKIPNDHEYLILKKYFKLSDYLDSVPYLASYPDLTDIDLIKVPVEKAVKLNDEGLRSKPINLYIRLFQPMIQARKIEKPRALILYGGSGNAGIAAEALGYDVTLVEMDPARCQVIKERAPAEIEKWRLKLSQKSFLARPGNQLGLFSGE